MQRAVPRHFTAYSLTALFYVGVIALFYYFQTAKQIKADAPKKTQTHRIEMTLSTFVPEKNLPEKIVKKVEEVKEIEEKIEKKVIEKIIEPLPLVEKPKPKPIVKTKAVEKKVIKKKIVVKKKIVKKKIIKKKVVKKKSIVKKKVIKKVSKPQGVASTKTTHKQKRNQKPQASSAQKKSFWSKVRKKIEKHKYYPRIAKKRGMEGVVKVKFTILASGKVSNVSVSGSKMFHSSAKEAVQNAFPISTKNIPITLPKSVTLPLHYRIR